MSTLTGDKTKFKESVTKWTTETLGHADNFNEVHQDLINNDANLNDRMTKQELAVEKSIRCDQTEITINHNLDDFPAIARVMTDGSYGHHGFGRFAEGSKIQIPSQIEYLNENSIRLHLDEKFEGSATVSSVDSNNYTVTFSSEETVLEIKLM